ncbi:MAG: hypothetical protein AUI92_00015 [Thaumarchaeota archaeon 13_1_40CM_3_38_6]|nr:MAG: hypothetical protein AUI92_00015 [Thaumarchaeota archaeon 13_1_40CM_3_38_6]OLD22542.1 MAG: hypothetical protein AUI59_01425 [Thaumarchaeota archaeon 13_1_40CM_2_39_13_1]OLE45170.1 MAG: hypothetical protein AUF73_00470 [Thaumarchaeota archaeon 13_1_20CM_2_39_11]
MYFSLYFSIITFEGWTDVRFVKIKVPPVRLTGNTFSLIPSGIIQKPSCVVSLIRLFFEMIFEPEPNMENLKIF